MALLFKSWKRDFGVYEDKIMCICAFVPAARARARVCVCVCVWGGGGIRERRIARGQYSLLIQGNYTVRKLLSCHVLSPEGQWSTS